MTLKDVLRQALVELNWEDEIKHDDSDDNDFIVTPYDIDGQTYTLKLYTDEKLQHVAVYLKSPFSIPSERRTVAAIIMNFLNGLIWVGNLGYTDKGSLYYRWTLDVEGTAASTRQIHNLINGAADCFDPSVVEAISSIVFTKKSADEIIAEYHDSLRA